MFLLLGIRTASSWVVAVWAKRSRAKGQSRYGAGMYDELWAGGSSWRDTHFEGDETRVQTNTSQNEMALLRSNRRCAANIM